MGSEILNPRSCVQAKDLEILGPLLIRKLQGLFPFSSATVFLSHMYDDSLPPVKLSDRQKPRAQEALGNGEPFWDRVSCQVLLPLAGPNSGAIGTLVLSGVSRVVGPEESQRILPLLKTAADQTLSLLKHQTIISHGGEHPLYLIQGLERLSKRRDPTALLHLFFRKGRSLDHILPVILQGCSRLFKGCVPHLMGMGLADLWIEVEAERQDMAVKGLKSLVRLARKNRTGLHRAYLHLLPQGISSSQALSRIDSLENAAMNLGINVMSTQDLQDLEERLGIASLSEVLNRINQAAGKQKSADRTVVFARPVDTSAIDFESICQQGLHAIPAGKDSAFFIIKGTDQPDDAIGMVCSSLSAGEDNPVTIGAASCSEPTTKDLRAVRASLWAYIHATLLGKGSHVAFDALSWNVAGDEHMALGDITGAMDAYRKGLRINDTDANLWNSLGVCLGQMGRKKEAEQAFKKAVGLKADHYMALYNLAGVYEECGRDSEALKAFRKAMKLCPGNLAIATRLSQLLLKSGHPEEVIAVLEPLTDSVDKGISAPLRSLARAFRQTGNWPRAKACLERALHVNPSDKKALALLAIGYWQEEDDKDTGRHLAAKVMESGSVDRETIKLLNGLDETQKIKTACAKKN